MSITLGIDIGTSKCASVCRDADSGELLCSASVAHHADISSVPDAAEQDVGLLLACVVKTVSALPEDILRKVSAIGVTGQMHSVMGRNSEQCFPLITWQDKRCGNAGLLNEYSRLSGHELHDGFGAATLARLGKETASWEYAATIMDHLVLLLCGNEKVVTDPANAASWGLLDDQSLQWDEKGAAALGIRKELLPEICPSGSLAGHLCNEWSMLLGVPAGTPVAVATGDNQASILGTGTDFDRELYLTLGTGAQLSAVISEEEAEKITPGGKLELRPFPGKRKLAVCSCLCGGYAFTWLGETLQKLLYDLGIPAPPLCELLDKADALGLESLQKNTVSLQLKPHFLGERTNQDLRGSICGITPENFTLGNLAAADAVGILDNLLSDFPAEILQKRSRLLGSGNGIRKVKCVQTVIRQKFLQEFILQDTCEEAASGAARLAANLLQEQI